MVSLSSEPAAGMWIEDMVKGRLVPSWERLQQSAQLLFPCNSEEEDAESSQLESVSHEVESSQLLIACSHNSSVVGHLIICFIMLHLLGNKDLIVIFNQETNKGVIQSHS